MIFLLGKKRLLHLSTFHNSQNRVLWNGNRKKRSHPMQYNSAYIPTILEICGHNFFFLLWQTCAEFKMRLSVCLLAFTVPLVIFKLLLEVLLMKICSPGYISVQILFWLHEDLLDDLLEVIWALSRSDWIEQFIRQGCIISPESAAKLLSN